MIAIDAGNTSVKFARFDGAKMLWKESAATNDIISGAGLSGELKEKILAGNNCNAALASVVPQAQKAITEFLSGCKIERTVVASEHKDKIIRHNIETIETTGVDRLLAARGALELKAPDAEKGGLIVIQAGSAITVDYIDASGVYNGGLILPGVGLWLKALADAAAIPLFDESECDFSDDAPTKAGKSTRAAVLNGLCAGLPDAVCGAVESLQKNVPNAIIVMTGGWADKLSPRLGFTHNVLPDLVLTGMALAFA